MPGRTAYDEGTPNWVELHTPEPEVARSFYGRLFGWTFDDRSTSREARAVKNGGLVAAIASGPDAPATWNTYLNVADVDAAAARVEAGGGTLLTPPQDTGGEARTAFAADPTGATFGLWQAGAHIGATSSPRWGRSPHCSTRRAERSASGSSAGLRSRTVNDDSPAPGRRCGAVVVRVGAQPFQPPVSSTRAANPVGRPA